MVPKQSGFNQSDTTFPGSSAMGRDGEVKQRQHFYHHGDTICHPKSGYVTTKLHGTSTCRRNNNAIFSDRAISRFLPAPYPSHVNLAAEKHCRWVPK